MVQNVTGINGSNYTFLGLTKAGKPPFYTENINIGNTGTNDYKNYNTGNVDYERLTEAQKSLGIIGTPRVPGGEIPVGNPFGIPGSSSGTIQAYQDEFGNYRPRNQVMPDGSLGGFAYRNIGGEVSNVARHIDLVG